MKLNVSVCLSSCKGKKGKQQVQVYNNGVAVTQDAVNKQLQLLAKSIDDVNAAVLHLAKTSVVKPKQQEAECDSCCKQEQDELCEVELDFFDEVKIVNQNLVILDGDKFKVVEALDALGNPTKKLKDEAITLRGFWKD